MEAAQNVWEAAYSLPPVLTIPDARARIRTFNAVENARVVVLDDDPTGCQTVHGIPILMDWEPSLLQEVSQANNCFFILTNSRAYSAAAAAEVNTHICQQIQKIIPANQLRIISRSDSTLRGHFRAEVEALTAAGGPYDGILVVPYFKEGGRFTLHNTHYVQQNGQLVPAHQTEFAQDPVFGFQDAYLPNWIEEKSGGRWSAKNVVNITLTDIREGGPNHICHLLEQIKNNTPVVINALCDEDLEVVVLGLCLAESKGKRFLYRTAASFVKIRAGITNSALYQPPLPYKKGLVIVGSHIQKSTEQLQALLGARNLVPVEVLLSPIFTQESDTYLHTVRQTVEENLAAGHSVVVYTQRGYALDTHPDKLQSGRTISDFLSDLVAGLTEKPDFVIAKGGITSHDTAAKGLAMKQATVLGQIAPGVPVWQAAAGSKFPGITYVVFPGNVGDVQTLREVYLTLI